MAFLTDRGKEALAGAARAIEAESGAEVVFAVRPSSGSYLHVPFVAGIAAGVAVLTFLLWSPWPFGLTWFLVDPLLGGAVVGLTAMRSPLLCRLLTSRRGRRRRVEICARSTFVERGVHRTRGRTGVLIYVSVLEREAAVVADVAVEDATPVGEWHEAVQRLSRAVTTGCDATRLAELAAGLAPLLAQGLPRPAHDLDELSDEVLLP